MHARSAPMRLTAGLGALFWLAGIAPDAAAFQAPSTYHVRDVRLSADENAAPASLLVRGGRIEAVLGGDADTPPGARVIEGKGGIVVPAFIDAYAAAVLETPEPVAQQDKPVDTSSDVRVDMRAANRKGIQPALFAHEHLDLTEKTEGYRKHGFGAMLASPSRQLLSGNSALVTARDAALRSAIIDPDVFAHAALRASGSGYPTTVMGFTAQLRQFFMDVQHHRELSERYGEGRPGSRPPHDAELEAGRRLLEGRRLMVEADSMQSIERWLKLSDEFGLKIALSGGREAYRVADLLRERDIPVVLTLNWGDEPKDPDEKKKEEAKEGEGETSDEEAPGDAADEGEAAAEGEPSAEDEHADEEADEEAADEIDWEYEEPVEVRRDRRRRWEEARDGAIRLHEAGVDFAFGSGSRSPKDLLERVRELVEAGLPHEVALAGLTSEGAELCGVSNVLGQVAAGFDASFGIWVDPPLEEKAKLAWLFIDGFPHEFEVKEKKAASGGAPAEGADVSGSWEFISEMQGNENVSTAELTMDEEGAVSGVLKSTSPMDGTTVATEVEGSLSGSTLTLRGTASFGDMSVDFTISGELDGDEFTGEAAYKAEFGEFDVPMRGVRKPKGEQS